MERYLGTLYDSSGRTLSGVTVTVLKAGTAINASLYSDDGVTTKSNGFTNDADGSFEFYAPNGRYDVKFTKTGVTFTDDNSKDVILYDPRDDDAAIILRSEFFSIFKTGSDLVADGHHWRQNGGLVQRVAGDSTYRNGWLDVIEAAAVAGSVFLSDDANALAKLWVPTTDVIVLGLQLEKVGAAVVGTRRAGLADSVLTADPTNGVFVRQIDAANAFGVVRAGAAETTVDLGVTLNAAKKIKVTIITTSVRFFVDDVAKTPITTNIPTAIMGASLGGGAVASAAGIRAGFFNVYSGVRV